MWSQTAKLLCFLLAATVFIGPMFTFLAAIFLEALRIFKRNAINPDSLLSKYFGDISYLVPYEIDDNKITFGTILLISLLIVLVAILLTLVFSQDEPESAKTVKAPSNPSQTLKKK